MLVVVLCLPLWSLAGALLLRWILGNIPVIVTSIIPLVLLGIISVGNILRFWGISLLLLILITGITWLGLDDVNDVDVIVLRYPLLLLVLVIIRMNSIGIEISYILCLVVDLIRLVEFTRTVIIDDFNLFLNIFSPLHIFRYLVLVFWFVNILFNLFLWTEKEFINLTLSLMFYRIVSSLYSTWIHWQLTTSCIILTCNLNSWLGSRWTRTWCSYFSPVTFTLFFHIFTSNVLDLLIMLWILSSTCTIINNDIKFIKFIQTSRIFQVSSSLIIVTLTLSSSFNLIWVN